MSDSSKIKILKGLDSSETERLAKSVDFVFKKSKLNTQIEIINNLAIELNPDDYLIVYLDEITLNQLSSQSKSQSFFASKKHNNQQILLILDDVDAKQLPDYLSYMPAFEICLPENLTETYLNKDSLKTTALIQVVYDMALYINQTKSGSVEALTIYIGPSDDNTTEEYQKIIRELLHRNLNLIPKIFNPSAKEILENPTFLNEMLKETDLAIHFIGHQSIDKYPNEVSPAMKINELVAKYCENTDKKLQRIIYVPDENESITENTRLKIAQFKSNMQVLKNAELVQTPVEKLKNIVLTKISEVFSKGTMVEESNKNSDDVYFIYAPGSEDNVDAMKKWFAKSEINFSISQIELDQLALLHYHQNKLKTCKGVVIFNNGNYEWLSRKLSDILKAPGWGRNIPFQFKIIVGKINDSEFTSKYLDKSIQIIEFEKEADLQKLNKVIHT